MASTQTVSQLHSAVVPFREPAVEIPQAKLELIILLRNERERLKEQLEAVEAEVRAALEANAPIEPGVHVAELKESLRRNVSWREVAERLGDRLYGDGKGEPYCEKVLSSTKPTRSFSLNIR
jgi:hypothetical protein